MNKCTLVQSTEAYTEIKYLLQQLRDKKAWKQHWTGKIKPEPLGFSKVWPSEPWRSFLLASWQDLKYSILI